MAAMGRRRKVDLGLEPRVYLNHGAFFYVHRDGRWERLGTDKDEANRQARIFNDPDGMAGTLSHFMDLFLADCTRRVGLKSTVKGVKLSQRTLDDYQDAFGTREDPGPVREYFAAPRTPYDVTPDAVQQFLRDEAEAGRPVQGNRRRAALSACFGWMLRHPDKLVPGLKVNPCLQASGIQRNPESKRLRYVTHAEFREVMSVAPKSVRLLAELTYRTLQRPESDIVGWDSSVISSEPAGRFLRFRQNKTGQPMAIAFSDELDELLPRAAPGKVRKLVEPLVRRLDGHFYTYDGLSGMLKEAIAAANVSRKARGQARIASFGYRDLKGKGATDMWLAGTPVEQIQALLGHANKTTTEIYVKQRWREAAQPNTVRIG